MEQRVPARRVLGLAVPALGVLAAASALRPAP